MYGEGYDEVLRKEAKEIKKFTVQELEELEKTYREKIKELEK